MTSRAVFGDFAQAARWHLKAVAQRPAALTRPSPASVATEIQEYCLGLHPVLRTITRYTADLTGSLHQTPGHDPAVPDQWARAAVAARDAAQRAYLHSPLLAAPQGTQQQVRITGVITRELAAAADAITAGRDLLQTHFTTSPDGTREPRSPWSADIDSVPLLRAQLAETAHWARQILTHAAPLTTASTLRTAEAVTAQRRLAGICQNLHALVRAVETAQREPVPDSDRQQLYAIPVSTLQPARRPGRDQTITELCQGITASSARVRAASAASARDSVWSPDLTAESFRRTASSAAAISRHCSLIGQALAERAAEYGLAQLSQRLRTSSRRAGRASQAWLHTAREWALLQTDAVSGTPAISAETAGLMRWTRQLAYAAPAPDLTSAARREARAPHDLAPSPDELSQVAAAIHGVVTSLTAIAVADRQRIGAAAEAGRLLTPTETSKPGQVDHLFTRASRDQVTRLLDSYRSARIASIRTTVATARVTAEASDYRQRVIEAREADQRTPRSAKNRSGTRSLDPATPAAVAAAAHLPGPVEMALIELGDTRPGLRQRAVAIDQAASQLLDEAAHGTAVSHRHPAARNVTVKPGVSKIIGHEVDHGDPRPAAPEIRNMRSSAIHSEAQQAEP